MVSNKMLVGVVGSLVVAVVVISLLSFGEKAKPEPAVAPEPVRFAIAQDIITGPVLLAREMGFFKDEGLNVTYDDSFSSGKTAFQAMLAGKADVSTVATTPAVFAGFSRDDFVIFVTYTTSYKGIKVLARKDAGIKTAKDLKGKRIGVVRGTISELMANSLLAYNKILISEVEMKHLNAYDLPKTLHQGELDAIAVWSRHVSTAKQLLKDNVIDVPTDNVYRIAITLTANRTYAAEHPEVPRKIVAALNRATDFIQNHPEEAQNKLAEILKIDPAVVKKAWLDCQFSITLDQLLLMTMEAEAKWAITYKHTDKKTMPNYLNFLYFKAMDDVKPDAVTIFREKK